MLRGAGILEYASTISFEKLLVDNEIAGQALRMVNDGIDFSEATRAVVDGRKGIPEVQFVVPR